MANNRMYLLHVPTGRALYLAKYYPSTGWFKHAPETLGIDLMQFFNDCDFWLLTDEQRKENNSTLSFPSPHTSSGGFEGADYAIAYEGDDRIRGYWAPRIESEHAASTPGTRAPPR